MLIVRVVLRAPHHQKARQDVNEDSPHPGRHRVRLRRPKVNIEHHHRHTYTETEIKPAVGERFVALERATGTERRDV